MNKWITFFPLLLFVFFGLFLFAQAENTSISVGVTVTCPNNNCDKDNNNVSILHVLGCTDSQAENYKASADQDDGSCYYTLPVEDLSAEYDEDSKKVILRWTKPRGLTRVFKAVVIVKKTSGPSINVNDGDVIYDGSASSFVDADVISGRRYYYTAFVRGGRDNYSSGVVSSVTIPEVTEPPKEPDKPEAAPAIGADPFRQMLVGTSTDPLTAKLNLDQFVFSQLAEKDQKFSGGKIFVRGDKNLTIWINYDSLPEDLKTIGITILDPQDRTKGFSFLMRANEVKTRYEATIGRLASGNYPIYIYIINFSNQTIKRLSGTLVVLGGRARISDMNTTSVANMIEKTVAPVASGLGLAVGAANLVVSVFGVASFSDLYLLILRGFGALLGFFGYRRRNLPWGTVYDAITKRPIDPAYVVVEKNGEAVADAITDIDGRFGFFLPAGQYSLKVNKTHYQFPSQVLSGKERDELYDNLYFGGTISTSGEEVISCNIPLDPIGFDWNEFIKNRMNYFTLFSKRELIKSRIINTIFTVGFLFSLFVALVKPSNFNFVVLFSYVVIYAFELYWKVRHRVISVKKANGEILSFAVIKIYLSGINQMVKTVVTDQFGRFYALVRPGTYYYTVDEKMADGSYREIFRSGDIELKKGVFTQDIVLPV
jgi:hypothetical protein